MYGRDTAHIQKMLGQQKQNVRGDLKKKILWKKFGEEKKRSRVNAEEDIKMKASKKKWQSGEKGREKGTKE